MTTNAARILVVLVLVACGVLAASSRTWVPYVFSNSGRAGLFIVVAIGGALLVGALVTKAGTGIFVPPMKSQHELSRIADSNQQDIASLKHKVADLKRQIADLKKPPAKGSE